MEHKVLSAKEMYQQEAQLYRQRLVSLLSGDLDFHQSSSSEFTHDLHAFAAKFPPQLPRLFIEGLTAPGDVVLDPMSGSGTTIVEAFLVNRLSIGLDIDPLALLSCRVKTTPMSLIEASLIGNKIISRVKTRLHDDGHVDSIQFDLKSQEFVDYWFHPTARHELMLLLQEIRTIQDQDIRLFMELVFSSIIITKSGGVSLALDLAHTRPHKVQDKKYRSPIKEFEKRLQRNLRSLNDLPQNRLQPHLCMSNAQQMPLAANGIDLIVTSPPYPANAIDYMRAHKFSLVWFGHSIESLSRLRKEYIGSESVTGVQIEHLPEQTRRIVLSLDARDKKKGLALSRYYSEMTRVLREMYRVLKPGKAAVVVVGSSNIRGADTYVSSCLEEIGQQIGFEVPHIGIRRIDRDRRMLPVRRAYNRDSQIEKRMHEEHVIGFLKPVKDCE